MTAPREVSDEHKLHAVTLKRQGVGYYSVHLHGECMSRLSVWDRRKSRKRCRGWLLRINGGVLSGGTREEIFQTLALLRDWVTREYSGDPVGAERAIFANKAGAR